jgi:hypothetical protein
MSVIIRTECGSCVMPVRHKQTFENLALQACKNMGLSTDNIVYELALERDPGVVLIGPIDKLVQDGDRLILRKVEKTPDA